VKAWYDEYIGRTVHANKLLMEEIDRVRSRVVSTESQGLSLHEKVSQLSTSARVHSDKLKMIESWNEKLSLQIEVADVETKKIEGMMKSIERVQAGFKKVRQDGEENKTRFLMVENFVEKYQPILVQIAISNTLSSCIFKKEQLIALENYEAKSLSALHQTILQDTGMPELVRKVNEIRKAVENKLNITNSNSVERESSFTRQATSNAGRQSLYKQQNSTERFNPKVHKAPVSDVQGKSKKDKEADEPQSSVKSQDTSPDASLVHGTIQANTTQQTIPQKT